MLRQPAFYPGTTQTTWGCHPVDGLSWNPGLVQDHDQTAGEGNEIGFRKGKKARALSLGTGHDPSTRFVLLQFSLKHGVDLKQLHGADSLVLVNGAVV